MLWYPKTMIEVQIARDWVIDRLDGNDLFVDGYPVVIVKALPDGDAIIRAAMIFTNYTGKNVFMAGASDTNGWMAPREVAEVLAAPFLPPMSVLRVTALVSKANKRSARLMEGFGFKLEGILRDYDSEGSRTLVYGLTKSDFLGGRYGRKAANLFAGPYQHDDGGSEPVCVGLRPSEEHGLAVPG